MENTTWRDATVCDWLKKRTVAIRIDADSEPDLAVGSGITGLPVTIFYRPDRTEIGRIIGYHGPVDFLQKASAIVEADKLGQKK